MIFQFERSGLLSLDIVWNYHTKRNSLVLQSANFSSRLADRICSERQGRFFPTSSPRSKSSGTVTLRAWAANSRDMCAHRVHVVSKFSGEDAFCQVGFHDTALSPNDLPQQLGRGSHRCPV